MESNKRTKLPDASLQPHTLNIGDKIKYAIWFAFVLIFCIFCSVSSVIIFDSSQAAPPLLTETLSSSSKPAPSLPLIPTTRFSNVPIGSEDLSEAEVAETRSIWSQIGLRHCVAAVIVISLAILVTLYCVLLIPHSTHGPQTDSSAHETAVTTHDSSFPYGSPAFIISVVYLALGLVCCIALLSLRMTSPAYAPILILLGPLAAVSSFLSYILQKLIIEMSRLSNRLPARLVTLVTAAVFVLLIVPILASTILAVVIGGLVYWANRIFKFSDDKRFSRDLSGIMKIVGFSQFYFVLITGIYICDGDKDTFQKDYTEEVLKYVSEGYRDLIHDYSSENGAGSRQSGADITILTNNSGDTSIN